jgi:xylose isomerase
MTDSSPFFPGIERIGFEGEAGGNPLAFRYYDAERQVLGKSMRDQLRIAVCYWHTFCWDGSDVFGDATFDRPWQRDGDALRQAEHKLDVAFEFFGKLGVPFFTFHDRDIAPEGSDVKETSANLRHMIERAGSRMEQTGVALLWGTANLFSHPRYAAGAASNPDPEVFARAAHQVKEAMEVTHELGGANYVLWGGREGYDTLLNTNLQQEIAQLGRFMQLVAEHKHKIGFTGTLLIEPKPMEPTKHQYDFDAAAVYAFLQKFGLEKEYKLNIEVNHATLAGHSFQHELAYASANGILGSVDINRGDPQLGWDTDQFPKSVEEATLAIHTILRAGGLAGGGFNFDAKLRRQSIDPEDLFHAHVGAIDTLAQGLLRAEELIDSGRLEAELSERYAGWDSDLGREIMLGDCDLAKLAEKVEGEGIDPKPRSGGQERLENQLSRFLR